MLRIACIVAVAGAALFATDARAQFANRSLGLGVGYEKFNNDPTVDWALPLSLESSLYIENGFDITLRIPLMILTRQIDGRQFVATGGNLGVRYLFSEEQLRPYAGLDLRFLHMFHGESTANFFGVGPHLGVDYFLSDSVSLGARATLALYIALNAPVTTSLGAQAVACTYF